MNQYTIKDLSNFESSVSSTDYWNTFHFLKLHRNVKKQNYTTEEIETYLNNVTPHAQKR